MIASGGPSPVTVVCSVSADPDAEGAADVEGADDAAPQLGDCAGHELPQATIQVVETTAVAAKRARTKRSARECIARSINA